MNIAFLGREYGLIVRDSLQEAGYKLVDSVDEADLIVVGFYGEIIKREVLEIPRYGALNVHPSLLPRHRGPTPVPTTILNGEATTGVSIIQMDERMDHGPILAQQEFRVSNFEFRNGRGRPTTPELLQILWEMGADLLVEMLPKYIAGDITLQEQDHSQATFTKKLMREDGRIDWKNPAEYIERQVRAFIPWPGTYTMYHETRNIKRSAAHERRLKILRAFVLAQDNHIGPFGREGKTFLGTNDTIAVQTGKDFLIIEELQLEGKKQMATKEFLLGYPDFVGTILA